jgi:hypothetical protein
MPIDIILNILELGLLVAVLTSIAFSIHAAIRGSMPGAVRKGMLVLCVSVILWLAVAIARWSFGVDSLLGTPFVDPSPIGIALKLIELSLSCVIVGLGYRTVFSSPESDPSKKRRALTIIGLCAFSVTAIEVVCVAMIYPRPESMDAAYWSRVVDFILRVMTMGALAIYFLSEERYPRAHKFAYRALIPIAAFSFLYWAMQAFI